MKNEILVIAIQMVTLLSSTSQAADIYVNDTATGSNDGSSWDNALRRLRNALDLASPGDTIHVATGTYYPDLGDSATADSREEYFHVTTDRLTILGGYSESSLAGIGSARIRNPAIFPTILSGDIQQDDSLSPLGYRNNSTKVVVLGDYASGSSGPGNDSITLDGLIIEGGMNTASVGSPDGAGILVFYSSNIIARDVTFRNNRTFRRGGALHARNSRNVILENCQFLSNEALSFGSGAAFSLEKSDLTITDCSFYRNVSTDHSGVGDIGQQSKVVATGCLFQENRAASTAAVFEISSDMASRFDRCSFIGNISLSAFVPSIISMRHGGGDTDDMPAEPIQFLNCVVSGNRGLPFRVSFDSRADFINVSVDSPGSPCLAIRSDSPSIACNIDNCIFWTGEGGTAAITNWREEVLSFVRASIIGGSRASGNWSLDRGIADGGRNLDADPLFVRASAESDLPTSEGDLRIQIGSPAIDAGFDTRTNGAAHDIGGRSRIAGDGVDMGAYETRPIYVNDTATGSNNGTSWADAFLSLQDALHAALPGDSIRVAEGIYYPDDGGSDSSATFELVNGTELLGGYLEISDSLGIEIQAPWNAQTILSGDLNKDGTALGNTLTVVSALGVGDKTRLDGFTISNGVSSQNGGGIRCVDASPRISRCIIEGNTALSGGGLANESNSVALYSNCLVRGNVALTEGGGTLEASGANTIYRNCTFQGNYASGSGGAVYIHDGAEITIANTVIWGNESADSPSELHESIGFFQDSAELAFSSRYSLIEHFSNFDISPRKPFPNLDGSQPSNHPIFVLPLVNTGVALEGGDQRVFPGSPLLDAGSSGMAAVGTDLIGNHRSDDQTDVGAYEGFAFDFLQELWATDEDEDGVGYGLEYATGTDPNVAGSSRIYAPTISNDGSANFRMGFNESAQAVTEWRVYRSSDLIDFDEVIRFHGPTGEFTLLSTQEAFFEDGELVVREDLDGENQRRGFYRVEAHFIDPS